MKYPCAVEYCENEGVAEVQGTDHPEKAHLVCCHHAEYLIGQGEAVEVEGNDSSGSRQAASTK